MRYIIVLETPFLVHCLQEFISGEKDVVLLLKEDFPLKVVPFNNARICSEDPLKISTYQKLMISSEDRVILHAFRRKTLEDMLQPILKVCDKVPMCSLNHHSRGNAAIRSNQRVLPSYKCTITKKDREGVVVYS